MTGSVRMAVDAAIDAAPADLRDIGTQQLARMYAELIDNAAPAAKYRVPLEIIYAVLPKEPETIRAFNTVIDALSAHSVASDLGPKLLNALAQLGLTPHARGTVKGGPDAPTVASRLDELRAKRRRRDDAG